jgi:hypothetical protein
MINIDYRMDSSNNILMIKMEAMDRLRIRISTRDMISILELNRLKHRQLLELRVQHNNSFIKPRIHNKYDIRISYDDNVI